MTTAYKNLKSIIIDDALLRKIEVDRLEDNKGGFQRRLDERKVAGVIDLVDNGYSIPSIMVADVNGRLICLDGQHRLEARRRKNFPLFAQISEMTEKQAAKEFVAHNGLVSKVSRRHRMLVDPGEYATNVRGLAKTVKADVAQVEPLLDGITGNRARHMEVDAKQFALAREILGLWAKDKRWTSGVRHGKKRSLYASPAVLKMVGSLVKENPKNAANVAKALKAIDYTASSSFGRKAGCTNEAQADMKQYTLKFLFRNNAVK